ncbi:MULTISPECIES: shikimate dehydrogenase [Acinetobacter]|uniref:Shikimate dehydrogenase (NADP(+)) n=1 Tax=Acinetobacter indicus CIP 110367 TaxID=1341679 RepID=V2UBV2_9GAMM|nr:MULTISPECIES: shikimate dehydrogenase [Acinetobacter]ENW89023.1 shikimate dehydrogenase [Acinetobacter sp. CIP 53.82]EPF74097.1 shikimate dehydrogenase [Acinetobacter indicus ANC 4215]ESK47987.1 shikimate dehydrogenase [Acinetobacter indicus CIP 110367]MBA0154822.1 shikimate dehydrogenase [Acinetobacter indicus]MDM1277001.1 shikimate dehydrogenase [Acinetobacter indicus]
MRKQFAVVGNPIEQSRSPELHHAFAEKTGVDLVYRKRLAPLDGFEANIREFFAEGGVGMNVTVPFKEQAFALCDVLSERAKTAKAVNTLWMQDGQLHGDNTDGQGLVDAIRALNWNLDNTKILIIGAGGATRGVIYPLVQAGVKKVVIANRTLARAEQLVADLQQAVPQAELSTIGLDALAGEFDIVINATSASLSGDALILPDALQFQHAYEMAYGKPSSFLEQAKARQIPTSEGFGMLVGQAIESFSIWNGVKPDLKDFL